MSLTKKTQGLPDNDAVVEQVQPQESHESHVNAPEVEGKVLSDKQRKEQAIAARASQIVEDFEGTYGQSSGDWEFVANLQNQAQPDKYEIGKKAKIVEANKKRKEALKEIAELEAAGKEVPAKLAKAAEKVDTKKFKGVVTNVGKTVGYEIKALKDGLKYPVMPLTPYNRKTPAYRAAGVKPEWKTAKKGEVVALSKLEFAILLSEPEYNGAIDGNGYRVFFSAVIPEEIANGGEITEKLAPSIQIKAGKDMSQSIKERALKYIITKKNPDAAGEQFALTEVNVEPGYERFAALYDAKPKKPASTHRATKGVEASQKETRNANLAVFRSLF